MRTAKKNLTKKVSVKITLILILFVFTNVNAQNLTVTGGLYHSVFLCGNGEVYSTGENLDGQLGNGTTTASTTWVQVLTGEQGDISGFLSGIAKVDAGSGNHSIAMDCDGAVYTWGGNIDGRLGNGTTTPSSTPVRVLTGAQGDASGFLVDVVTISAANLSSYALLNTGELMAWGENGGNELGDGTTTDRSTPIYVMEGPGVRLTDVAFVDGGDDWTLAMKNDGTIWIWGTDNNSVMNGYGNSAYAVQLMYDGAGGTNPVLATEASAGDTHGMFVDQNGNLWAWGGDWAGQLGNGGGAGGNSVIPVPVIDGTASQVTGIIEIAGSNRSSIALKDDGTVYTFGGVGSGGASGNNNKGQLGDALCNSTTGRDVATPVAIPSAAGVIVDISEGDTWSFLIDDAGQVFGFGENQRGGGTGFSPSPFGQGDGTSTCVLNAPGLSSLSLPCGSVALNCISANLGPDIALCNPGSVTLQAQTGSDLEYRWYKDGSLLTGDTSSSLFVNTPGTYKVVLWDSVNVGPCGPCPPDSDEVVVTTTQTTTPNNTSFCAPPCKSVNLSVTGSAGTNYDWYDAPTGGTKLNGAPSNTFTTSCISNTTTYYVEDLSSITYKVGYSYGDAPPLTNETTDWHGSSEAEAIFDAVSLFNFDSVTVRYTSVPGGPCCCGNPTWPLTIELLDNTSTVIATVINNVPCASPTLIQLPLGIANIPAGNDYKIRIGGAADRFSTYHGGAAYPQGVAGILDINSTGNLNAWAADYWSPFYDWVITSGSSCSRVPVQATLNCSLPVEWLNFFAKKQHDYVYLEWFTSTEENNDYFVVERSSDGTNFTSVGQVNGGGNTYQTTSYQFIDHAPLSGTSYYRIVQYDFDGQFSYSDIRTVFSNATPQLGITPNPNNGNFTLDVGGISGEEAVVELVDVNGKLIRQLFIEGQQKNFALNNLPKGVYFVRLYNENEVFIQKMLVL